MCVSSPNPDEDAPYQIDVFENSLFVSLYYSHSVIKVNKFGKERKNATIMSKVSMVRTLRMVNPVRQTLPEGCKWKLNVFWTFGDVLDLNFLDTSPVFSADGVILYWKNVKSDRTVANRWSWYVDRGRCLK